MSRRAIAAAALGIALAAGLAGAERALAPGIPQRVASAAALAFVGALAIAAVASTPGRSDLVGLARRLALAATVVAAALAAAAWVLPTLAPRAVESGLPAPAGLLGVVALGAAVGLVWLAKRARARGGARQ